MFPGEAYRTDATAWAIVALDATGSGGRDRGAIESGRSLLAGSQLEDGRVSLTPSSPDSYWPTSLAILAWHGSEKHAEQRSRAINFLLRISGKHWVKEGNSPLAHDTSIRGWSWTQDTHSWVEPTSLAILALRIAGHGDHVRVREGIRLLEDRQLPAGGWNYGNTLVYGKEMYPQPDCTGLALSALAGCIPPPEVGKSLKYLQSQVTRVRTPLSLGWGILGLAAWGQKPGPATAWVTECMSRQEKYDVYDTTLVSLLLLALKSREGLVALLGTRGRDR
jgi:hypothetical protein